MSGWKYKMNLWSYVSIANGRMLSMHNCINVSLVGIWNYSFGVWQGRKLSVLIPPIFYQFGRRNAIRPNLGNLRSFAAIIDDFGATSGLRTNLSKCSAHLIRCPTETSALVDQELGCPVLPFPLRYLGLSLGLKRPTTTQRQYLMDAVTNRLPGWRACMLNRAGRPYWMYDTYNYACIYQNFVSYSYNIHIWMLIFPYFSFSWISGFRCHQLVLNFSLFAKIRRWLSVYYVIAHRVHG
jgi:hypothetical protein